MSSARITQNLKPLYLLSSSEPLLLRDWLDQTRQALREAGFEDLLNLQADAGFDWNELGDERNMLSLFSSRKCRIVTLPNGKPGVAGGKFIQALCEDPPADDVYIFVVPQLDRQARNAAWFKALQRAGEIVELKPIYDNQLAEWIQQRARSKGLTIDLQSAQFLAERTEGNLLAADQDLEKLSLRFSDHPNPDFDTIEASVAQSARYSHFILVDACLGGNARRALKILRSLRAEGYATAQLRWAIQAALEQLDQLKRAQKQGGISDRSWQQLRIWRNKQRLYQAALARLGESQIERLLQSCAKLDRLGKGQQDSGFPDPDWFEITALVAGFSGIDGIEHERSLT